MPPLPQRFEAKVDRRGEHHRWLGATDHRGVGLIRVDGALTTARRVGSCQGCRGAIPVERLEVIPHARLCVICQADPWGTDR